MEVIINEIKEYSKSKYFIAEQLLFELEKNKDVGQEKKLK